MSTRCSIQFTWDAEVWANVYRHSDGYPNGDGGILASLDRFFAAVEEQAPGDTRFNDPSYLAAKFIVWQTLDYGSRWGDKPLAVIGVGVQTEDPGDIAYRYRVDCGGGRERPAVTWQGAGETDWHSGPEASGVTS